MTTQESPTVEKRALRPRSFAKRYDMSDRLVYQLLREGRLPAVQVNGRYLVLCEQFEREGAKPAPADTK